MPDTKISNLTDGGDLQATDELPLARSGTTVRTNGTGIADFMVTALASTFDAAGAAAAAQAASQPLDSDLTAIAALATTSFGRALLTLADAAALRTDAGLVIGTNVEAWDADLDDIAALSPTNDDIVQRKAGHWTNRTMAQLISDLAALGTTFQPLDSDLTAIAALTTTAFGRGLLTAANAAGLGITAADVGALGATAAAGGDLAGNYPSPTIGANKVTVAKLAAAVTLDAIATANATGADVSMNSHKITNLTNGSAASDAAAFGQIPTALPPNGSAGGDLAGTYPNPTVKAITETSGPTDLSIGTITDGQFLKRSGSTLVSATTTLDQYPNTYITVADETIAANTQVEFEDYLELSASFVFELASGAMLVIGDYATPLPAPDQNPNIFITVADETIPPNSEVVFSDFYELSAPFALEVAIGGLIQLGTGAVPAATVVKLYDSILAGTTAAFDTGPTIPPGYSSIEVVLYLRGDTAATAANTVVIFNNDGGSNYDQAAVRNSANTAAVAQTVAGTSLNLGYFPAASATANFFGPSRIRIPSYDQTSGFKVGEAVFGYIAGTSDEQAWATMFQWRSTTPLNQIKITPSAGNFVAGSRMLVYGYP